MINTFRRKRKLCNICNNEINNYLPLNNYYELNQRQYGYDIDNLRPELLNKNEYTCPFCGSADRDRMYSLYIRKQLDNLNNPQFTLVDIAPSPSLSDFIKKNYNINYKTLDKYMDNVNYKLDIMNMDLIIDNSVDAFICSHVLEHVEDDLKAMNELKRILKPKTGWGILVVPIDLNCDRTLENINATAEERWKYFGQDDHVRKYSKQDYILRIRNSGLRVQQYGVEYFGEKAFYDNALEEQAVIYVVSKE